MGNLVIYHADGEPIEARATITKAEQSQKLNAEDVINVEVGAREIVPFESGDYIDWCGRTYTLNQLPSVTKKTSADFHYSTVTFESEQYELLDIAWLLPTNTYGDSFTGNLKDFLDILIENTERSGKTWTLGEYPAETDDKYKTLTYSQTNCLNVLQNLCKEWGVEFLITRDGATRVLDIKVQIGELFPQRFEYGRTGGAYKIERKTVSNQNVITRLFVFGSDKNLPSDYRSNKLCLPGKTRNESYITDEESVRFYGIKENVKVFADIYPARYGTVTAVDVSNKKIFFDSSMDFDLNETNEYGTKWLIPSTVAKIQFNSGGLAGYSFDLTEYDHATKRFKIKTYTDANGLQFPNDSSAAFQIKTGDEYFIYDIRMPQSYIDAAEAKLQAEGEKFYEENCRPHVNYAISISSLFLKHLYGDTKLTNEIFKVGDSIEIYDYDLDLLKTLRIAGFTRNLMNPYEFTLTIAENVEVQTQFQRVMRELTDIRSLVYTNDIAAADNARRNWLATQDVLNSVFDPEGHYYSEKIKPLSIETTMLAVGARSQQFILKNVNFEPNYHGDPNAIHSTAGTLEHYTIAEPDIRTWRINQSTATDLAPNTVYYIYAKCPRDGDTGFILYDNAQHTVESDPQFYHFLVGTLTTVLSDVNGNRPARNIALTYGSTSINGRFINAGRIESADKSVYIDLDNNLISGVFNFVDGLISGDILVGKTKETATAGIHANGSIRIWAGGSIENPTFYIDRTGSAKFGNTKITNTGQIVGNRYIILSDGSLQVWTLTAQGIRKNRVLYDNTNGLRIIDANDNQTIIKGGEITSRKYKAQVTSYNKTCPATVPLLMWSGKVHYASGEYRAEIDNDRVNYDTSGLQVSASRVDTGTVLLLFKNGFSFQSVNDYFVTTQGISPSGAPSFAAVWVKEESGFYLVIADDSTKNDYDAYVQIWYNGNRPWK